MGKRIDPFWAWKHKLKKFYGITPETFWRMEEKQQFVCAICGDLPGARRLDVDHYHTTGKVRGLLCGRCHKALGLVEDDVDVLINMIIYLNG